MTKMTTEEAFVKVLQKHGIAHAFGIIGYAAIIPWHWVIRSNGALGGFSGKGGLKTKRFLLKKEGIKL